MKALVAAAKTGQFAHVLERARQDRDDAAQRAQAEADLAATGVRVIDAPGWSGPAKRLGWAVRDAEDNELTAEQHAACPGHVAWVEQDWVNVAADGQVYDDDTLDAMDEDQCPETETVRRWVPVLGCEDPATHHPRPGTTAASGDGMADAGESEAERGGRAGGGRECGAAAGDRGEQGVGRGGERAAGVAAGVLPAQDPTHRRRRLHRPRPC